MAWFPSGARIVVVVSVICSFWPPYAGSPNVTENRYIYQVMTYLAGKMHCMHSHYICGGAAHQKPRSNSFQWAAMRPVHS
jgi:hypothetical protein